MSLYDIYDELTNGNMTKGEALSLIAELTEIDKNKIVNFVENICYEENLCPDCFVELESKDYVEMRPYGNHEVGEIIYIKYCPECGQEF